MTLKINYAKNLLAQSPMANDQKLLRLKDTFGFKMFPPLKRTMKDEEAFQFQFSFQS